MSELCYLLRILIVDSNPVIINLCLFVISVLLAVAIPNLDLFISLIGALCLSALGIAFPAAIQQCTWWKQTEGRAFYTMTIKNIALVIFGILGLIVGTYVSLKAIVEHFGDPEPHPS